MENKNLNNSLFYGNIVKFESSKELLNNTLFFVDYIDDSKIILISENMESKIFNLNSEGGIDNIDKIIIIHRQEEGYCVINRLLPGKMIKINFSNNEPFIQGEITKLENDMITVKTTDDENIYIDFEYSGLLEKYNIRSIDIINNYESVKNQEYGINEEEEETKAEEYENIEDLQAIYTIEQQVNDYIEKSYFKSKNKKQLIVEIQKYKMLLGEYTNLEEGVKIKQISDNQLLKSIFDLSPKVVNLFSYYLHKDLYCDNEKVGDYEFDDAKKDFSEWQYSVNEKSYDGDAKPHMYFSQEILTPNITIINNKREDHHNSIILDKNQNVAIINKVTDTKNKPFFFCIGKEGEINVIEYDMVRVDKGTKILTNGIVFKNKPLLHIESNTHEASNLLSKVIQNLNFEPRKLPKIKMLTDKLLKENEYFDDKYLTFYSFKEKKTFREYLEELNFTLKELQEQVFDRKEVSIYQCLKKLGLFNISKLNINEHLFIQKFVQENISAVKRTVNNKRNHFIKKNKSNNNIYEYIPHETVYEIIKNIYLAEVNANNSKTSLVDYQIGELLSIAGIDNMELLLFELRFLNRENNIDLNDEEVSKYISDLQAKLNGEIKISEDVDSVEYSKYYLKQNDMINDTKKIIISNIIKNSDNKLEKFDVIQHLYENIIANTQFDGMVDDFVKNLDMLLHAMHEGSNTYAEFDDIFKNESDQENIMNTLVKYILNNQIRKHDKCYVEEDKKFYIYDGEKWVNTEDFNNSLSKKKLLRVKNSIDEFEDIKTKIINDSVIKYAHKNEIQHDDETFSGEITRKAMKQKIKTLKYNKLRQMLKYNKQKYEFEKMFENMNYDELQYYSPYTNLLYIILGIKDLERKYSLIQRFISLFTVDTGDKVWFYCIKKNTKLIPKYLQQLSEAYLLYNTHDSTIKEICLREGYLSENGDSWIHKESGFTIKEINFDTNYGYDENGFKIKLDTVGGIDDIEEDDANLQIINRPNVKSQTKINKKIFILVKEMCKTIMKDLHIKFKNIDNQDSIYTAIYEIFEKSSEHPKYKEMNLTGTIYSVLSMILIYVQCKNILVERPYSSCELSFLGFPYHEDESSLDGIEYLACYLDKRVNHKEKKNTKKKGATHIFVSETLKNFSLMSKNKEMIKDDLIYYIKNFLLKNSL